MTRDHKVTLPNEWEYRMSSREDLRYKIIEYFGHITQEFLRGGILLLDTTLPRTPSEASEAARGISEVVAHAREQFKLPMMHILMVPGDTDEDSHRASGRLLSSAKDLFRNVNGSRDEGYEWLIPARAEENRVTRLNDGSLSPPELTALIQWVLGGQR